MGKNSGFTLLELLVSVAVVGILVSIAYPSYQQFMVDTNRAGAQRMLLEVASAENQFWAANNGRAYVDGSVLFGGGTACVLGEEPRLVGVPEEAICAVYTFTAKAELTAIEPPSFELTATPKDGTIQAGDGLLKIYSRLITL